MSPSGEKREHLYKILVIGELGTGKTSFIKRYVHQFFSQNYRATIGVDFALKVLHWDANTIVRLQLWDIAGQERFGNMTRVYYKEAVGAFIVFDVTRSGTFDCVSKWKEDLDSKVQLPDGSPIPCILLANKVSGRQEQLFIRSDFHPSPPSVAVRPGEAGHCHAAGTHGRVCAGEWLRRLVRDLRQGEHQHRRSSARLGEQGESSVSP